MSRIQERFRIALYLVALAAPAAPIGAAQEAAALAWLAGSWSGVRDGVASEEHWTTPDGGALVGLHKDVRDGKMASFEFLRIVEEGGRLCYVASPRGAAPTSFCAVELGERRVVFENLQHDFPQRILYWLDDRGDLHARVEGPPNEKESVEEWVWSRASR
jgi:hypothetical protein